MFPSRTHFLLGLLIAAAACGPAATPPTQDDATGSRETPQRGGILHFPIRQPMDTLDPYAGSGVSPRVLGEPRYEPLIVFKQGPDLDPRIDFEIQPWLAERWEQPDDTTYVLHLRKGVKWHDGQEFTAEDVAATFRWVGDPQRRYRARSTASLVASVQVIDASTVRLQTKRKEASFLRELRDLYIVPRHVADGGEGFEKMSVGTGPFRVVAFDSRAGFALERNPAYWDAPRPHLDGVVGHYGLDDAGMLAAFVARQTDLLTTDHTRVDVVKQSVPDVQVNTFVSDYGQSLYFRLDKPPYDDVRVRRALHLAVDRQAMLETITNGQGAINPPGVNGSKKGYAIPPEELMKLPGYDPATKQRDIQEAKRLLAEAGYPTGFKDTLIFPKGGTAQSPIVEVVSSQLKAALGVDLVLNPLDAAVMASRDTRGDFTVELAALYRMDMTLAERFRSGEPLNTAGINDPQLDRIIDAMHESIDQAELRRLAREAQLLLLDRAYIVPTVDIAGFPLAHAWVRNYSFGWGNPHATPYWFGSDTWLDVARMPAERRDQTPKLGGR